MLDESRGGLTAGVTKKLRKTPAAIHSVSLQMFSTHGYEGTSMRQIAMAVGVNAASLYNHYPSKQSILAAICIRTMQELIDGQDQTLAEDPRTKEAAIESMRAFVHYHTGYHIRNREACRVINRQLGSLEEPERGLVFDMRDRYEHRLREAIQHGVNVGLFRVPDAQLASYAILAMGMNLSVWYNESGPLSVDKIVQGHAGLVFQMLGVHRDACLPG